MMLSHTEQVRRRNNDDGEAKVLLAGGGGGGGEAELTAAEEESDAFESPRGDGFAPSFFCHVCSEQNKQEPSRSGEILPIMLRLTEKLQPQKKKKRKINK